MTRFPANPLIREATPADAAAIAQIHIAGWRWGYRGQLPDVLLESLSLEGREARWRDALAPSDEEQTTFVAQVAGRVVGFAACELRYAIALPVGG
jgi:hypothetical protein